MELDILRIEKPAVDAVSIYFKRTAAPDRIKAGQYGIFSFTIEGVRYQRTYSFHTPPDREEAGITVRAIEGGVVSHYLQTITKHARISLVGVAGNFFVEPVLGQNRRLIMFAGGSGITPLYSMIQSILDHEPQSTISLVYSNRAYERILFRRELEELKTRFEGRLSIYHVVTQDDRLPADFPVFYRGRLSPLIIRKIIKGILSETEQQVEYYLCGPSAFMDVVSNTITTMSSGPLYIRREAFFVPAVEAFDYSTLPDRQVVLEAGGIDRPIIVKGGQSILGAALQRGIDLPYSCTVGQCGVCRATLLQGEVRLRKNFILTDEEQQNGQILLCQGFPVSDGVAIRSTV